MARLMGSARVKIGLRLICALVRAMTRIMQKSSMAWLQILYLESKRP